MGNQDKHSRISIGNEKDNKGFCLISMKERTNQMHTDGLIDVLPCHFKL